MQNKFEGRLVNVNDVIEAIDKHTREDETLDEDISVILEEVKTAFDEEKVINEIRNVPHGYYNTETENEIIKIIEKGGIQWED